MGRENKTGPTKGQASPADRSSSTQDSSPQDTFKGRWDAYAANPGYGDDQSQDEKPALADWRRADLHRSGITDEVIDRLGIRDADDGRGWLMPWTDFHELDAGPHKGTNGFEVTVPDRDKRRDGKDGKPIKVEWPTGQRTYPGCVRLVKDSTRDAIVEGPRQALAVASYAPEDVSVWIINGINGLNAKTRDRLDQFKGHQVVLVPDGDWKRNDQVGRAVTETLPAVLDGIAAEVLVADVGGIGRDGADDVLGDTLPEHRAEKLAKILDHAKPVRDRRLELATEYHLIQLQAREQAQRIYVAQSTADVPGPGGTLLGDLLAEPDNEPVYRIRMLWPTGGNVVFSAQRKAGKTTARDNLIRSLADGDPFLAPAKRFNLAADRPGFEVKKLTKDERVYVADLELDRRTLRRWFRDQSIRRKDRVMVQSFRGQLASFDVLDKKRRSDWAAYLAEHHVRILIVDPLAALLDVYGFDENSKTEVGRVLVALDTLKAEAGISELMVIHHMGHAGERSRGTSRLRDWPDAEWFLTREHPDGKGEPPPDAARFFSADGRDVRVWETKLAYDYDTRRLWAEGGTRTQHQATKHQPAVLKVVEQNPGLSGRDVVAMVMEVASIKRDPAWNALRKLIKDGKVRTEKGPKNANLHHATGHSDTGQDQGTAGHSDTDPEQGE